MNGHFLSFANIRDLSKNEKGSLTEYLRRRLALSP